jgi:inorganic pyrophosphatase
MRIVTSGRRYLDIDAYAGCIAFSELLRQLGQEAEAVSTSPLNDSVSPQVRRWPVRFSTSYRPDSQDTFTVIDVSDPTQLDSFVDPDRVDQVIDHHLGFESHWHDRIKDKAQIEFVGAASTQVYERWLAADRVPHMSQTSARLLICGILDNTLNFGAEITSPRDRAAYTDLLPRAGLPADWPARYFRDCEHAIIKNMGEAIQNDTKILEFQTFDKPLTIGQLVVWDGRSILDQYGEAIRRQLSKPQTNWFMNLISLSDHSSLFISDDRDTQEWLSGLLGLEFKGSLGIADRPWLRKEIVKRDIEQAIAPPGNET